MRRRVQASEQIQAIIRLNHIHESGPHYISPIIPICSSSVIPEISVVLQGTSPYILLTYGSHIMTTQCSRSTQGADRGTSYGRMVVGYRDGTQNVAIIPVIGWLSDDRDSCLLLRSSGPSDVREHLAWKSVIWVYGGARCQTWTGRGTSVLAGSSGSETPRST